MKPSCRPSRIHGRRLAILLPLVLVLLATLACNLSTAPAAQSPDLSNTQAAVNAQLTTIAKSQQDNLNATQVALDVKSTLMAEQEARLALASTQAAAEPVKPTDPPQPTATPVPPTQAPTEAQPQPSPAVDLESQIKNAKILLYEDVAGYYNLNRWVRDALNGDKYTYTDVGDAVGNFKSEMLAGTKWDLIIAAAEARKGIQGEFYTYLADAANNDVGVIIEVWYLDQHASDPIKGLLSDCGVTFMKNWMNPDRNSRSVVWLNPDHPLFHEPNDGISLVHYSPYWEGDAGDLLMKKSAGKGEMVAGLYTWEKSRSGVLANCNDGRVIIQTFSTHDYLRDDMIKLWQNYIYNTLKNHFLKINQ